MTDAHEWLDRIKSLPLPEKVRIMNVCGGHERAISAAGLRGVLPDNVELIPGPGCPVCICPEEDIYHAIRIGLEQPVTVVSFGDMLRVPVNAPKSEPRSLEEARAAGADIRPIASPQEALRIARSDPGRDVVFLAAGFETTTAPVAAMISEGLPYNLLILLAGRRTWPAVAMLLESGEAGFEALVAPGHVSTVMGPEEWAFVAETHGIPCAVAGFTPQSLLPAFFSVLSQYLNRRPLLHNCYPEVVRPGGNRMAQKLLAETMDVVDGTWRGIGVIPKSGYALREELSAHDARRRFPLEEAARKRAGQMPPGCDCARVVLGKIYPNECVLYGRACTPRRPVGPCMVSDEGACRIWWSSGVREPAHPGAAA